MKRNGKCGEEEYQPHMDGIPVHAASSDCGMVQEESNYAIPEHTPRNEACKRQIDSLLGGGVQGFEADPP